MRRKKEMPMPLYLVMVLVAFSVFMLVLAVVSTRDIFEAPRTGHKASERRSAADPGLKRVA
jgi:hypothetical protein